jgi:hypothetical protein
MKHIELKDFKETHGSSTENVLREVIKVVGGEEKQQYERLLKELMEEKKQI